MKKIKSGFLKFIANFHFIALIYLAAAALSAYGKYRRGPQAYNNYLIFKNVFKNTLNRENLYLPHPGAYLDINHYGIFFSAIIAPFTVFPDAIGMILWNIANAAIFLYAVKKLPFSEGYRSLFAWLCLQEYITAAVSLQFNVALAGLIILSAIYIYEKKETKSACAILVGTFVKIYGVVGFSQFLFVQNKSRFLLSLLGLALLFLVIPMLYSSPQFGLASYVEWFQELLKKNAGNEQLGSYQDISVMGFFRRINGDASISNLYFHIPALLLFFLPYIRINQYKNQAFRLMIVASSLIFLVLFSTGSESPTYIIAVSGVSLWFVMKRNVHRTDLAILLLVLVFTCFSSSDLFPRYIKQNYIIKYSLKAVPCAVAWLRISYELMTKDFEKDYRVV